MCICGYDKTKNYPLISHQRESLSRSNQKKLPKRIQIWGRLESGMLLTQTQAHPLNCCKSAQQLLLGPAGPLHRDVCSELYVLYLIWCL